MFCPQFVGSYPHFVGFIPFFVGFKLKTSRNNCLVFSHDENSSGYSACDSKYGDISELGNQAYKKWEGRSLGIQSIDIENKIKPKNMYGWFQYTWGLNSINVENIDTSQCTNMVLTFYQSHIKTYTGLNNWNVSKVESMNNTFGVSLQYITQSTLDLSNWDTESCKDFSSMFEGCQVQNLNISSFNTSNAASLGMINMFSGCSSNITYGPNFINNSTYAPQIYPGATCNKPSWYQ